MERKVTISENSDSNSREAEMRPEMESEDITILLSEKADSNVDAKEQQKEVGKRLHQDKSNLITRVRRAKEKARLKKLLGRAASAENANQMPRGEFIMEKGTILISENADSNLRAVKKRQETEKCFRHDRSNVVSRAQLEKDRARLAKWLMQGAIEHEKKAPMDEFAMDILASRAFGCFEDQEGVEAAEKIKKEYLRVNSLNAAKASQTKEEHVATELLRHPQSRMDLYFKDPRAAPTQEPATMTESASDGFESLPSGTASVIRELTRLEDEKEQALMLAHEVAEDYEGNPYTQRANVFERRWVLVSEDSSSWKLFCEVFSGLRKAAEKSRRQIAACKNCATIFFPFFPDSYHMHRSSTKLKSCLDSRSGKGDRESLLRRAAVGLAIEAGAYKKEGDDEYIKAIRVVKGIRGNSGNVKYGRLDLCENSNIAYCENNSTKAFECRNLAVGILKLVIQLHLKIPVPKKLVQVNQHGAGLDSYFQRYRSFVPEFKDETLFRCFLIEFGQHARRTARFDPNYEFHSNWWSGPAHGVPSNFVAPGSCGVLVRLDKSGLVQLAKALAQGTFRVLDDYLFDGRNGDFLRDSTVEEETPLQKYLEGIPPELEEEEIKKERLPVLRPLEVAVDPETRNAAKSKKTSETMIGKRPPDLDDEKRRQMDRKRQNQIDSRARQKTARGRFESFRRKVMMERRDPGEVGTPPRFIAISPSCRLSMIALQEDKY